MSKTFAAALTVCALLVAGTNARASSAPASKDKPAAPAVGIQRVSLPPPSTAGERLGGLRIIITQVSFPGVAESRSCRFSVRAINDSHETVSFYTLLRTFDGAKGELNSWMVPTGDLAPGQASERLYSCKMAQFLSVDRDSMSSWPGRCMINGDERSPCPLTVSLEANMNLWAKD